MGLGNIGSQTTLALARLGLEEFHLYDHDQVESHNLSSQSFFLSDLGISKVLASNKQLADINPAIMTFNHIEKFVGNEFSGGILIIAVDSMKERRKICEKVKEAKYPPSLIIDGRMGGPQLEVYTCKTTDEWESTFVDVASTDSCGARYICYISMVIGAFIANQVKRHLNEQTYKKSILFNIDVLQLI